MLNTRTPYAFSNKIDGIVDLTFSYYHTSFREMKCAESAAKQCYFFFTEFAILVDLLYLVFHFHTTYPI